MSAACAENLMTPVIANHWVFDPKDGLSGYRCKFCSTWKHASQFLLCHCDQETQFIICGPVVDEEQTYWHNERGWVVLLSNATTLPREILTSPLPPGASGIMELTMLGEYVRFLQTLPHTGV